MVPSECEGHAGQKAERLWERVTLIFPVLRERHSEKRHVYLIPLLLFRLSAHLKFPLFATKSQAKPFPSDCLTLMHPLLLGTNTHTGTHTQAHTHLGGPFGGLLLITLLSAPHIFGTICCLITKIIRRGGWWCQGGGGRLLW